MAQPQAAAGKVRFGPYAVDRESGELLKHGTRIKLQEQPFQILCILLEQPGRVVTRAELKNRIWPADTFVEFDQGLYSAVRRLRDALCDSAETPRYVETLARRGYRFIAPVEREGPVVIQSSVTPTETGKPHASREVARFGVIVPNVPPETEPSHPQQPLPIRRRKLKAVIAVAACVMVVGLLYPWITACIDRFASRPITSIAVLPLENLSADPAEEYFAEGMTDELITDLAQLSDLRVISRASVMHYRGTNKTIPQIARELNVDALIEGTVARAGDRVRIRVQLIRATDDRHLWAQAFERQYNDILLLQSEVASGIAMQVRSSLAQPRDSPRLSRDRPVKPEAYEAYLNGRYFLTRRTQEGNAKAISYFQQAIQQDPGSALGYAGLSDAYVDSMFFDEPMAAKDKARAAAMKALASDPNLAEAHLDMAGIFQFGEWNWTEAEKEYKRAIELNPSDSNAHQYYSVYLASLGRFDEAISEAGMAEQFDPVSPFVHTTGCLVRFFAGRDDQAIEQCRKALEIDPNFPNAHANLAGIYRHKRLYYDSIDEFEKWASLNRIPPNAVKDLRQAYESGGIKGYLQEIVELDKKGANLELGLVGRADVYSELEDKAKALDCLEGALKERDPLITFLAVDPSFENLRSEPRFQHLVRALGLAQ